jgi:hypothetical protein
VTTFLDTTSRFNGSQIDNYNIKDVIDIKGLGYQTTTTATFAALSSSAGDLMVQSAAQSFTTIHLEGMFGSDAFVAKADGHGGTLILNAGNTA